jgi:glycosyltransferase involved in cell wall biosynthesis
VTVRGGAVHCVLNDWGSASIRQMVERIGGSWSFTHSRERIRRRIGTPVAMARLLREVAVDSLDLLRWVSRLRATHVFFPEYAALLRTAPAIVWLRLRRMPVVLRLGNAPEAGRFYRLVWRFLVAPLTDVMVCNSEFTKSIVLECGIAPSRLTIIRNVAPRRPEVPAPPPPASDVIYVGQVIPPKGLHVLLDAMGLLAAEGLDVTLSIVGDVDGWESPTFSGYRSSIVRRAEADDLRGRVHFLGWREDVPTLMRAARVHCCPSLPEFREAFGIVVAEAKAAGIPSIVFNTGALSEQVHHLEDGFLCDEISADALAAGLRLFLTDEDRRRRAGAAAAASLDPDDRSRFAAQWSDVFSAPAGYNPAAVCVQQEGPR